MKIRNLIGMMTLALCAIFASCSDSDSNGGGGGTNGGTEIKGEMKNSQLIGFVKDTNGNPLAGVLVGSGSSTATTDATGLFAFSKVDVVNGRSVVTFSKEGYFNVTRSVNNAATDNWDIVMVSKDDATNSAKSTFSSANQKSLNTESGMKVTLPAAGYKNDKTGEAYNGTVKADLLYLNPDDDNFADMMPGGDLAAVRMDSTEVQLISYGMLQVNMADDKGNKLQIADGKEAELTFPIPESLKENTPAQIPLWSFNETTGLWEEEGMATLKEGKYVGTVKHFSWVNLDWPESRATITGYIKNTQGDPIPNLPIHVGQTCVTTNSNGQFSCYVPSDTEFDVWVESEDYAFYTPVVSQHVDPIAAGTTHTVNITLPKLAKITGRVINSKREPVLSLVALAWGNYEAKNNAATGTDGKFTLYAATTYTGTATITVTTGDGKKVTHDIQLTGSDVNVGDIVISAPTPTPDKDDTEYGGKLIVTAKGKTYTFDLNVTFTEADYLAQDNFVSIFDNYFTAYAGTRPDKEQDKSYSRWSLEANDYVSGKALTTGRFMYSDEGRNGWLSIEADSIQNLMIKENGKVVTIDVSGKCSFRKYDFSDDPTSASGGNSEQIEDESATMLITGMKLQLSSKLHTVRNITKSTPGIPSFTPFITDKYLIGSVSDYVTNCTGAATILANGGVDELEQVINTLKSNGFKSLENYAEFNKEQIQQHKWYSEAYYKGKNIVSVEYNGYTDPIDEETAANTSAYLLDAPILLGMMEGVPFDPSQFTNSIQPMIKTRSNSAKTASKFNIFHKYSK